MKIDRYVVRVNKVLPEEGDRSATSGNFEYWLKEQIRNLIKSFSC